MQHTLKCVLIGAYLLLYTRQCSFFIHLRIRNQAVKLRTLHCGYGWIVVVQCFPKQEL